MGKIKYLVFQWCDTVRECKPSFRLDAEGIDKDGDKMMDDAELLACERGLHTMHDVVTIDGGYQVVLA